MEKLDSQKLESAAESLVSEINDSRRCEGCENCKTRRALSDCEKIRDFLLSAEHATMLQMEDNSDPNILLVNITEILIFGITIGIRYQKSVAMEEMFK